MQAPVETLMKHSFDALRIIYKTATYWSRIEIRDLWSIKKIDKRCPWVLPRKKFVIIISGLLNAMYNTQSLQHIYKNCYFSLIVHV